MPPAPLAKAAVKQQVVDKAPKRFKELKFGIQSNQDIVNQAIIEISDSLLYDVSKGRRPADNGPLDKRLGTSSKTGICDTCGDGLNECNGHFGHVRLALPVFHIGYLKFTIMILQQICKGCARVLLTEKERRDYLRQLRNPTIDNMKRVQICKRINTDCRKVKTCMYCGDVNGQIRKYGPIKLAHDKFVSFNKSTAASKVPPVSKIEFERSFDAAKRHNPELERHIRKAMDDLNPLRVLNLFKMISSTDCELLGINPAEGRPESFLWQYVPAPPTAIRPSVDQDGASNEDELTTTLSEIIHMSSLIKSALQKGQPLTTVVDIWDFMAVQVAKYVNSDVPGLQRTEYGKLIRGFCQRLKGKQGRFRGNLSGKRVDFSARTVISPDPNLGIDQVAVPVLVAMNMSYPEVANKQNLEKLRKLVETGETKHPGAKAVQKKGASFKVSLKFGDREKIAKNLKVGDIVERHIEDGDVILFNRQPSLHKLSIMSHYAKVRPWRTFRLNECVCTPYNADFDGDEMNLHVPQTEEARAEAINLMGVKNNLSTPKNGEPIISATQDFITAAYLLSGKENFFDRKTFTNLCMYMLDGIEHLDLPPPSIVKPEALWTGKQVFSVLMRPNSNCPVKVNLDAKCRDYKAVAGQYPAMDINDGWLVVRNSEVLAGLMDKSTVGSGKKDCIFYIILRDFGPDEAVKAMNRLAKLSARYLTNCGFSIGISDVYPSDSLQSHKAELVERAYAETKEIIKKFEAGTLEKATGCNEEQTMENAISGILSKVRQQAGDYCIDTLSKWNSPLIMAKSGSKGSNINVAQMVAVVGQQIIGGQRVANGFQDRTLPHFPKHSKEAPSKGFVRNSFFTGLTPTEFLFHAISGREGLVDTAVKTAETGYMSRRLMKSLEDLSAGYDRTVRTSSNGIVQFTFGADNLDPVDMEGNAKPVHFDRTFIHAQNMTWDNEAPGLLPWELVAQCNQILEKTRKKFKRTTLVGGLPMDYYDKSEEGIDNWEGSRAFLETVVDYVKNTIAAKVARARKRAGLPEGLEEMPKTEDDAYRQLCADRVAKVSEETLHFFVNLVVEKFWRANTEPGTAVGAVGAQSIGEPGTQMTLKTFHFAGVAGMSITQGVPRIKEIINASKTISTPVITCPLLNNRSIEAARIVKARIEKTYISDVLKYIEDGWTADTATIVLGVDKNILAAMQLGLDVGDIADAIVRNRKLKIKSEEIVPFQNYIRIYVGHDSTAGSVRARGAAPKSRSSSEEGVSDILLRVNYLKRMIPTIPISGYPEATRAIINSSENEEHKVLVEGYGLRACMTTEGVLGKKTTSNNVMEVKEVLGIEAARHTIAVEIGAVMSGMNIDPRHMELLSDVMTFKGEVLGITRFGLSKMRDSVLQLASFEKTPDHLFEAAGAMKTDKIEGVSECIIMGQTMSVGTGAFHLSWPLKYLESPENFKARDCNFEKAWQWDQAQRKKELVSPAY